MWPESEEQPKKLRTGLTTGTCATACCVAAAQLLLAEDELSGKYIAGTELVGKALADKNLVDKISESEAFNLEATEVEISLPRGKKVRLLICERNCSEYVATAATIKDAGDDPDVTHGAKVSVSLKLRPETGVQFFAGEGVGTVTREGLALAVGEPAINPVPRKMMTQHLESMAESYGYSGGFDVTVEIADGANLALKTMNPRLGILGGLSVLGTTGIVRPFSCSAYIASIHQGIDVAKANGVAHIAASTGNQSEAAIRDKYHLPEMALIEMGDFAGAVLKYLKKVPMAQVSICGGFGKISKLAKGHLDLHSRASAIDFTYLAELAKNGGASAALISRITQANTSIEALKLCQNEGVDLASLVCQDALMQVRKIVPDTVEVDLWVVNRQGEMVGSAS